MIKQLMSEKFQPLGPAIQKPVAEKPFVPEQVRPGVFKGADGKLYTNFKEHETPAVFHPPKQVPTPLPTLPVVPNSLGDGWIAWGGGKCPVEPGTDIEVRLREPDHCSAHSGYDFTSPSKGSFWRLDGLGNDIVAYRLIPKAAE